MGRPTLATFRQIHGRTAEVLHPDTGRVLGVVGYTRKSTPEWDRAGQPGTWWFDGPKGAFGDGYTSRGDAVRALRGLVSEGGETQ